MNINFKINYNLIPNEWSDFDYWGELINKYYERNRDLLFAKKYVIDIPLIDNMIRSVFCSIGALMLFFILKDRVKLNNTKSLLKLLAVVIIIEGIVIIYLINKKYSITSSMIIYLLPYYYACTYFIQWLTNKDSCINAVE